MGRDEMQVGLGMGRQPSIGFGLMGGEIVEHDMHFAVRMLGDHLVHEIEKLQPPPALVVASPNLASGDIERGEQRGGAVPLVFVAKTGQALAIRQPQPALRTLQRLNVTWVGCWAHARRKFFEAERESPKAVRLILLIIGWLYKCEADWDEQQLSDSDRRRYRLKLYPRRLYWLKKLATGIRERMPPKSGLAKACDYLLHYWAPLTAHLEHGETRLDNNLVENAIRPSAIGKKNWLFIGHPNAGQRSAIIYSIVVSCQRHGKDPFAYLRDVLSRLPQMTNQDKMDPLTPANWKPA